MTSTPGRALAVLFVVAAIAGALFAGVSTFDFVQHLDRQVHGAHCSFIPGLGADGAHSSGCDVALMSPYSSVLRTWVWGGLPVSLPGLALFVFMACRGIALLWTPDAERRPAAATLIAWSAVASLTSIVFAGIALFELETLCKSCMGIYLSSFTCLGVSLALAFAPLGSGSKWEDLADTTDVGATPESIPGPPALRHAAWALSGGLFVLAPCLLYVVLVPDFSEYIGRCGGLEERQDRYGVLIPLHPVPGGVETIEVFDPLCPACKALEERLALGGEAGRMDRKLVLFPLDNACNWMIDKAIHPGACATSEAVLCAEGDASRVVDWAFGNQERIIALSESDGDKAVRALLKKEFPELASCIGTAKARQRLNRSLRWAVNNSLRVLTPQVFIDGVQVCEEDTDLGLSYTLTAMLDRAQAGTLSIEATP